MMATSFIAEKLDLDLDLTTLDGTSVEAKPKNVMSAKRCAAIMDTLTTMEETYSNLEQEERTTVGAIQLLANELETIYDQEADWFTTNFDQFTLQQMLNYAAEVIGGIIKK